MYDREGPSYGILFGRMEDSSRFIANPPDDKVLLEQMSIQDYLGVLGNVRCRDGINTFTPD